MAVTIKLKNASGSDPSASDLVLGELAVRTDNGKIFLKKDDGNVAEVSGGGGIDDGDKGDITVSNSGATFTIDSGAVTYAKMGGISNNRLMGRISSGSGSPETLTPANVRTIINVEDGATADQTASDIKTLLQSDKLTASELADEAVTNAKLGDLSINNSKVVSDAAIAGTKISPDFGSQNIATTGTIGSSNLTITNTAPLITFNDSDNENDFVIGNVNGTFIIQDSDAAVNRFTVATGGQTTISGNLDLGAGLDVTGNISVSGTVDGRDVATDGSKLDGIESGATADQTASEILTLIKTVDGAGSGLDADTLDGVSSANFLRSNTADSMSAKLTLNQDNDDEKLVLAGTSNPYIRWQEGTTNKAYIQWHSDGYLLLWNSEETNGIKIDDVASWYDGSQYRTMFHAGNLTVGDGGLTANDFTNTLKSKLDGIESGATADQSASEILTLIKTVDGSGSGLDADLLDGVTSASFLRSDVDDETTGHINFNRGSDAKFSLSGTNDPYFIFNEGSTQKAFIQWASAGYLQLENVEAGETLRIKDGTSGLVWKVGSTEYTVWHSGNDGSGSGLDADQVDGLEASAFLRANANDSFSGQLTSTSTGDEKIILGGSTKPYIRWQESTTDKAYIRWHTDGFFGLYNQEDSSSLRLKDDLDFSQDGSTYHSIYHEGNLSVGDGGLTQNNFTNTLKSKLDGIAASATNVTNNNQLTNGAGYTTFSANQALDTTSDVTFDDIYANNWIRNNISGKGLYNQATGQHWYSDHDDYWNVAGGGSANGIRFRDSSGGTIRGYVYANSSNQIGFLDSDGSWAIRVDTDVDISFRVNQSVEATVLPDTFRIEGCFFENAQAVAANKTISDGYNAMSAGPITINSGVTVTIGSGEAWTIV